MLILAVLALALAGTAAWVYRDIPAETLEARYATDSSRFINIEGVRIHFRDEGSGPALLLIHANLASLLDWQPWAEALRNHYRVVRFDLTAHGLTGPDPTGDYSLDRALYLTERLIDALDLEPVILVGSSLGGTIALHYAATHPQQVSRLVLLSPGALTQHSYTVETRQKLEAAARVFEYVLPRAVPAGMIRHAWGDTAPVPAALVDRWHALWLREGQRAAMLARLAQYDSGDVRAVAAQVRTPTLLLWGEANPVADVSEAYRLREMLNQAEVELITYPGVGHLAVQEAGRPIARDLQAWLDDD